MNLKRVIVVAATAVGLLAGVSTPASATSNSSAALVMSDASTQAISPASIGRASAPAYPPLIIAQCNTGSARTLVNSFQSQAYGSLALFCGNANYGYVHIRQRHERDWQQVVDLAGGGGNWDDLMDFVTKQAIEAPAAGYPKPIGDGKACYTTPALILNSAGQVVRTLMPTVIISENNRQVITSIPTTGQPTC